MFRILAVIALSARLYSQPTGAKVAAFESPDDALRTNPKGERFLGAEARIVRQLGDGKLETLPFNHPFRSGESVQLRVRPQIDGFLVLYAGNDSGKYDAVFPQARLYGGSAKVRIGEELTIPLTFDAKPSNTILYLAVIGADAGENLVRPLKTEKKAPPFSDLDKYIRSNPAPGDKGIALPVEAAPAAIKTGAAQGVRWTSFVLTNR